MQRHRMARLLGRVWWSLLGVVGALCCFARVGFATSGPEGQTILNIATWQLEPARIGTAFRVHVFALGAYGVSLEAHVRLSCPTGLEVVDGDTTRVCHTGQVDAEWDLTLKAARAGAYELRASMQVAAGQRVRDEVVSRLLINASAGASDRAQSEVVWAMRVVNGEWYRFGGGYMVPCDSNEHVVQRDLINGGRRAQVVTSAVVVDSLNRTTAGGALEVPCVVFVSKEGGVRDVRVIGVRGKDGYLVALVREAVRTGWTFSPGMAKGRAVSDYVETSVHVAGR